MGTVVVAIVGVGGEAVVAEDGVGDGAVGDIGPLPHPLGGIHQPGGILTPDLEGAGDGAGIEVRGLREDVAVEEAVRLVVAGGGDDGDVRERCEARIVDDVVVSGVGAVHRQGDARRRRAGRRSPRFPAR